MKKNAIYWTKPTQSGLGDRLVDISKLLAYARIIGKPLYTNWANFEIKKIDAQHRSTDILLGNVKNHINFPQGIYFESSKRECTSTFDQYLGGDPETSGFHSNHLSGKCTYEEYANMVKKVAQEFTFNSEITAFVDQLPPNTVAFHIRRTDKIRDTKECGTMVSTNELEELNRLTFQGIDLFISHGYINFFICGDENDKIIPFVDYILSKGKCVIGIPNMEKWQATYYDFATMSRCDYVITSNRFSTFSMFPSWIGNKEWHTVYGLDERLHSPEPIVIKNV